MRTYSHSCELMAVGNDAADGLRQLCGLLDQKSEQGQECIGILPLQLAQPTMGRNGLLESRPQPAFAVFFRIAKEVDNGQAFLDGSQARGSS